MADEVTSEAPKNGEAEKEWLRPTKRVRNPNLRKAVIEIYRRKQKTNNPNYREVAEKYGVGVATLREYWCRYTKGRLDIGIPELAIKKEREPRLVHEKQLTLLRRAQAMLVASIDEALLKVERETMKRRSAKIVRARMKEYGAMEMFRSLDTVCRMISASEKGYLAMLDEYRDKLRAAEKAAMGTEVHATVEQMSESEMAAKALRDAKEKGEEEETGADGDD